MTFIPDWRQAWRWWSVRVSALAALLAAFALAAPDLVVSVWQLLPAELLARLPANIQMAVPLALSIAQVFARLLKQRPAGQPAGLFASTSGKVAPKSAGVAAAIAAAVALAVPVVLPLTSASEGTRLVAYQDPAKIWTICTGRTTGVKKGDRATAAQCKAWLHSELGQHMTEAATITPALVENTRALAAAGDFHYNAGPAWWAKSPMAMHAAARDWPAMCAAFPGYIVLARAPKPIPGAKCQVNAKGVRYCELPGLVKRRHREASMCSTGRWS